MPGFLNIMLGTGGAIVLVVAAVGLYHYYKQHHWHSKIDTTAVYHGSDASILMLDNYHETVQYVMVNKRLYWVVNDVAKAAETSGTILLLMMPGAPHVLNIDGHQLAVAEHSTMLDALYKLDEPLSNLLAHGMVEYASSIMYHV